MEVWLRTNTRAICFGMLPPALVAGLGLLLALGVGSWAPPEWLSVIGWILVTLAGLAMASLAWQMRRPRIAFHDGALLLWLRSGPPIAVPIEFVEAFLLGQAPSLLPGKKHERTEVAALTIKLADRASDWHRLEVKPQLGKWCEGYVTVRGTWCEPLSLELVNRLNYRLADVTRAAASK
jgi:hypothetical protein